MSEYAKNYAAWTPYSKHRQYLREGILGSPLAAFASSLMGLEAAMVKTGATGADIKKQPKQQITSARHSWRRKTNPAT